MTNSEVTPEKLLLAMMAILTCASGVSGNYTYWAYISNPPLLQVVDWTESSPVVFTNDSLHFPAHWSDLGPRVKEEGKTVNLTHTSSAPHLFWCPPFVFPSVSTMVGLLFLKWLFPSWNVCYHDLCSQLDRDCLPWTTSLTIYLGFLSLLVTTYFGRKNRLCREWTGPTVEEGLEKSLFMPT